MIILTIKRIILLKDPSLDLTFAALASLVWLCVLLGMLDSSPCESTRDLVMMIQMRP